MKIPKIYSASALQRQLRQVLDDAAVEPVIITRSAQRFVLMTVEAARELKQKDASDGN